MTVKRLHSRRRFPLLLPSYLLCIPRGRLVVIFPPFKNFRLTIMGEWKSKTSSKSSTLNHTKMSSSTSSKSNLTTLLQGAATAGNARLVRCPKETLDRLRHLNEAEVITLFTPFVPHPPSTTLAKDMDPFEPLGRALPRQVRHVPYRLDNGMTELHADFLPTSGAVVIVICATANVINYNKRAFEQQLRFARDVSRKITEDGSIAGIPVILLLVDNDVAGQAYANAMQDFPALVTLNDYTTAALANAVRVLFGK